MFRQTNECIAFYDMNTVYDDLKFKAPDPKMNSRIQIFYKQLFSVYYLILLRNIYE
jgi:hypothetical protein